ncbi:early nodulin-like protein 1 [Phalaenopsis equestris]|uniref:early nodulin-like protein 1 n=1 Tax=Phalaenopsis equestris TaxID=78828 RepID=UPI0009E3FC2E|nr:early nodulin-like protein 1 [Phalaenopsis equestris]
MPLSSHLFIFFLFPSFTYFLVAPQNHYKVGGDLGWRVPEDNNPDFYTTWATNLRFHVGDSLVFEYKNDSVIRVEKIGYYHCNESGNGTLLKDGSAVFLLDKPGFFFFVSGNVEHCKKGQRLMVDVMASHGAPAPFSGAPSPCPSPNSSATAYSSGGSDALFVVLFGSLVLLMLKWIVEEWNDKILSGLA